MANVLFTNVRIIDGSGAQPYPGEVLVQGNRIARVARRPRSTSCGARISPNATSTGVGRHASGRRPPSRASTW